MLRIDRVKTEMDVVPSDVPSRSAPSEATSLDALLSDPRARERIKDMVLEALRDHLRELERRGVI